MSEFSVKDLVRIKDHSKADYIGLPFEISKIHEPDPNPYNGPLSECEPLPSSGSRVTYYDGWLLDPEAHTPVIHLSHLPEDTLEAI